MLRSSLRPIARATSTRAYSSASSSSSFINKTVVFTSLTLAIGALAYTSEQRKLRADLKETIKQAPEQFKNKDVRKSVLDQPSLKEGIHKQRSQDDSPSHPAPSVVENKFDEAKSSSEGAFNEETGEINWDCPCLGGMADGPCGDAFKAAFSCFVYSDQEPKGIECVEKFKSMQDCFREHPDVYGEEIDDEDDSQQSSGVDGGKVEDPRPKAQRDGPKPPTRNPPTNNPALDVTPETTPTKGVSKLVPDIRRYDKARNNMDAPEGEGAIPTVTSGKGQTDGKGQSESHKDH